MLNGINDPTYNAFLSGMLSNKNLMYEADTGERKDDSSDDESLSDDGSAMDMNDYIFVYADSNGDKPSVDNEDKDQKFSFGEDEWELIKWEPIGIGDNIPVPTQVYYSKGPHGFKPGVADSFGTVI